MSSIYLKESRRKLTKEERAQKKANEQIEKKRLIDKFPGVRIHNNPVNTSSFIQLVVDDGEKELWISLRINDIALLKPEYNFHDVLTTTIRLSESDALHLIVSLAIRYNAIVAERNRIASGIRIEGQSLLDLST